MTVTQTHLEARVAVRVPRDGPEDLAGSAARRLEALGAVERADVIGLCGLEPGLSATVVRVEARLAVGDEPATVLARLREAPDVEGVEPAAAETD